MTMPSLRLGMGATGIYVAIIALATYYVFHIQGGPTQPQGLLIALLPIQMIAVLFCVGVVLRYTGWRAVGFGRLDWWGMVWFLPGWVLIGFMGWHIFTTVAADDLRGFGPFGLVVLVLTTFLIAFGEEVLFRGILLRGAMTRFSIPIAMLLSTVLFGVFHFVNGLAGQGAVETTQQVLFVMIVGVFLAPIAVRVGNLWPLIIWHWFWNMAVILGQTAGLLHPLTLVGIAVQAVVSIWLWTAMIRQHKLH
ncbi:lysostaphin resistance A-like protein [Yoonia sp.]|uniref:CPBP family intramembrane glutamic endopeptidase n=1 Tax=Yoonia sp. TaxID=2212373 RepID=UPI00358FED86